MAELRGAIETGRIDEFAARFALRQEEGDIPPL
jgi:hypothetical protein